MGVSNLCFLFELSPVSIVGGVGLTFITSSFNLGRKKSTI